MNKFICEGCGIDFFSAAKHAKWCPKCREENQRIYRKQRYENKKKQKARLNLENKSIIEILREIKKYNEQNGTYLSYGQYVSMVEKGEIKVC